jgi:hypothetical protein
MDLDLVLRSLTIWVAPVREVLHCDVDGLNCPSIDITGPKGIEIVVRFQEGAGEILQVHGRYPVGYVGGRICVQHQYVQDMRGRPRKCIVPIAVDAAILLQHSRLLYGNDIDTDLLLLKEVGVFRLYLFFGK